MKAFTANLCAFCSEIATLKNLIKTCLLGKRHSVKEEKEKKRKKSKSRKKLSTLVLGEGRRVNGLLFL